MTINRTETAQTTIGGVYGVVHLKAMPGDPRGLPLKKLRDAAQRDAEQLHRGGVDGIVVENFGSSPFVRGNAADRLPPHQVAAMALIAHEIKEQTRLSVGVNCLRNDAMAAMGIAAMAELDFIRVNVHTGAYVTDQGLIEGEAAQTLRYRKLLAAERIAILADVLVKHAAPLAPLDPGQAAKDSIDRGHADAVIVTGSSTGGQVEIETLRGVRTSIGDSGTVLVGSGLTLENAETIAPQAHGAIIGTAFKLGGDVYGPVDQLLVQALCQLCKPLFRRPPT